MPSRWFTVLLALSCACNFDRIEKATWDPPARPAVAAPLEPRDACAENDPNRRAFFGDLHVHTGLSMDARTRDVVLSPSDAYRYATGEPIALPPLDGEGNGTRTVRIGRPLDFAAVTDHAEFLAEVILCTTPGSPAYDSNDCRIYRGETRSWLAWFLGAKGVGARIMGLISLSGRSEPICGDHAGHCRPLVASLWNETVDAAEEFYDRTSDCSFTTFPAWEYSASPGQSKVHRNVILRNEIVPELPVSWLDEPEAEGLWRELHRLCLDTGSGCDALAIPHNMNLSNGRAFDVWYRDRPFAAQREAANLRAGLEPIAEMMQIKGESECRNGLWGVSGPPDELCGFEKIREITRPENCEGETGSGALRGRGCISRVDFVRYAVIAGLEEEQRIGVNPFQIGFIGSTDTHNATPGAVQEARYDGSRGDEVATAEQRLAYSTDRAPMQNEVLRNPGGLAGVWAEENSRDALFDAMRRRETFATSGPRIQPRFFAGWHLPADLCDRGDFVETAYEDGVPMGGELGVPPVGTEAPTFVASALRDPGDEEHRGGLLQRIQIIKGWVGRDGRYHQAVHDVAGTAPNGASVDLETCEVSGPGYHTLCGQWRDPDFDPDQPAVYYARVIENPSCRWSWRQCLTIPEEKRPEGCRLSVVDKVIQERAWTSPIWFSSREPSGETPE